MLKHPVLLVVLLALAILRASDRILVPSFAPSFYTVSSLHNFPSYSSSSSSLPLNISELNKDRSASTTLLLSPDVLEQSTRAVEDLLRDVGMIAHPLAVFGHILFVPASRHGADMIRSRLQLLATHHIPVDLIALDAFWWHPLHYFQWHPQFYDVREHRMTFLQQHPHSKTQQQPLNEDDEDVAGRRTTEAANVLIWVSCFLPTSTKEAQFAAKEGFLVTKEDRQPQLFSWSRSYSKKKNPANQEGHDKDEDLSASMTGVLLDVQNPHAAAWYSEQLAQFLEAHRAVVAGVRVGGVDSLLYGRRDLYHSRWDRDRTTTTTTAAKLKQIDPSEFTFSYYELIHRVMNRVRPDGSGIVLGRAVDSLGGPDGRPFHQYAPPAVVSTAWVGDHEFSVAGLRESAMNVLWSAKRGFGVLGTMIGPGVLPGLWRVEPSLVEREAEWLQQERVQLSATLCVGSEPVVQQECAAHVQWLEEEENFLRQVHEAATYASSSALSSGLTDAGENRARLRVHRARLCVYRRRQVQLFERWAQFSAFLPTMMESGGLTATSISPEREGAEDTAHVLELQNMLMTIVHRLVQEHQALRLYFASHSMDGSTSRRGRDHRREGPSTATATTRSTALLYPARSEEIHFAEPEGGGWALHVGPDLILIPVMDTLDDNNADASRKEERVKQSPTRRRTFKLGKHAGDRNALRDFLDDDTSPWWTVWHDPTIILRESDRELTLEVPPPFSPASSLFSSFLQKGQWTGSSSGPPLVLRRGGATIPLLLSRSSTLPPSSFQQENRSTRKFKKEGDDEANEEGSVGADPGKGDEGEPPPMVVLTVEQLWTGGVAATSSSGGPTNEPAQSVGHVALDPRGRVGGIRSTVTMQLLAKKINPPFPLHMSWEVQSAVAQPIVLSLFDSVLLLDSFSPKAPRAAEEAHREASCSCRFQQDERLRDMTGNVMFGEDAPSWLRSSSFVELNTEREQQEEDCANYVQDSQLANTSALPARFAWERHRLRPQLDASVTLANDRSRSRCVVVWDQSAGVVQLEVAMTYPGQNAQCDCKANVRLP